MTEPLVCAIMLTRDRLEMARRAVECFRAQTYDRKQLFILDNGPAATHPDGLKEHEMALHWAPSVDKTAGALRNMANGFVADGLGHDWDDGDTAAILIHWDDDDWSHPRRIAEQVALLQASGADCVGYREVLFWRTCGCDQVGSPVEGMCSGHHNEAWLYSSRDPRTCIGSSMCYWRAAWERRPFKDLPKPPQLLGEDKEWLMGAKSEGYGSIEGMEPRLICSIHGGNTQPYDIEANIARGATEWTRVPEWDNICKKAMTL